MSDASGAAAVVRLQPILDPEVDAVAEFLHRELNSRVSADRWAAGMRTPWLPAGPNYGFALFEGVNVVGANLAFYSTRDLSGEERRICNLGALCVLKSHRQHVLRLVRALLGQRGYHFTDLSPSGNVVELNRRLGFAALDTSTDLVLNLPWSTGRGVSVLSDPDRIAAVINQAERPVFTDHRHAPAGLHLLLRDGDQQCYLLARRDRRKGLPVFASLLHVSNPDLFARHSRAVSGHLLLRLQLPATLVERRVVGGARTPGSIQLKHPRPKMYKSRTLAADQVDYLYSELTQIPW